MHFVPLAADVAALPRRSVPILFCPLTMILIPRLLLAAGLAGLSSLAAAQPVSAPQPQAGLMPQMGLGQRLYAKNCAACHGADLKGSDKGPAFLHPVYEPSHHGDAAFQMAVKYGVRAHHWKFGDMPPVAGVSPDDVAHITAYVRHSQRQIGIR